MLEIKIPYRKISEYLWNWFVWLSWVCHHTRNTLQSWQACTAGPKQTQKFKCSTAPTQKSTTVYTALFLEAFLHMFKHTQVKKIAFFENRKFKSKCQYQPNNSTKKSFLEVRKPCLSFPKGRVVLIQALTSQHYSSFFCLCCQ